MKYTKINLDQWDRGELFQFYMEHMRIVMSLTVDVDVTRLIRFTRQSGLNFYGVMVWTVSKVVNAHDEFKYGWSKGGDLIRWEVISPSYVHFHPEDQRFTKLFTPFSPDLASFHAQFLADKEAYRDRRTSCLGKHPTSSTSPACPGYDIATATSMCSTTDGSLPQWSPGESMKRNRGDGPCH